MFPILLLETEWSTSYNKPNHALYFNYKNTVTVNYDIKLVVNLE
jgi:hypothetical protein